MWPKNVGVVLRLKIMWGENVAGPTRQRFSIT